MAYSASPGLSEDLTRNSRSDITPKEFRCKVAGGPDPLVSIPLSSKENGYDHQRT